MRRTRRRWRWYEFAPEALLAIGSAIRAGDRDVASQRYLDMTGRNTQLVVEVFRTRGLFEETT